MHNNYNTFLVSYMVTDIANQKSLKITCVPTYSWSCPLKLYSSAEHATAAAQSLDDSHVPSNVLHSNTDGNNNCVSTNTDLCVMYYSKICGTF